MDGSARAAFKPNDAHEVVGVRVGRTLEHIDPSDERRGEEVLLVSSIWPKS